MVQRYSRGMLRVLAWVVLALLACPVIAHAQGVYVVRAGATGANNGSDWANAYPSLPAQLVRGAIYYVADGTYGGYTLTTPASGTSVIRIKKATRDDHGPLGGWSDSYGDGVATFTGSFAVTSSYVVIDGSTGGGPAQWKTGHGFVFTSPAGTDVNYIDVASGVSNVTVRHVYFNQTGNTEVTTARANGVYNAGTLNNSLFEFNYFDNLGGLPFLLRGGAGNIFQYNYLGNICGMSVADYNQHCEGVVIHDMDDVHFRWNYVAESPSSGGFVKNNTPNADAIRIYGNVFANGFPINCNSGSCSNWRVFNNTFHTGNGGPVGGDGSVTGGYFYNNVVYRFSTMAPMWGTHDSNWLSRCTGLRCTMNAAPDENICVDCAGGCDSVTTTADPFVNGAGTLPEDYRLRGPIAEVTGFDVCRLDACTGEKKYNVDAFGVVRGADGVWDVGAYEFSAGAMPPPAAPSELSVR